MIEIARCALALTIDRTVPRVGALVLLCRRISHHEKRVCASAVGGGSELVAIQKGRRDCLSGRARHLERARHRVAQRLAPVDQFITSQLFDHETVNRLVVVERAYDIVPVAPLPIECLHNYEVIVFSVHVDVT